MTRSLKVLLTDELSHFVDRNRGQRTAVIHDHGSVPGSVMAFLGNVARRLSGDILGHRSPRD